MVFVVFFFIILGSFLGFAVHVKSAAQREKKAAMKKFVSGGHEDWA